jgi:hypothetical protein
VVNVNAQAMAKKNIFQYGLSCALAKVREPSLNEAPSLRRSSSSGDSCISSYLSIVHALVKIQ